MSAAAPSNIILRPLARGFYARPAATVARSAIGKLLVHHTPGQLLAARIVETEAYSGPRDRAAHSWGNRRTARTEVMFGEPGHAYVFVTYGTHRHFNLVAAQAGQPQAVLIRAVEPVFGAAVLAHNRGLSLDDRRLTNGPGKLCQALGIDLWAYGHDLTRGPLYLTDFARCPVSRSPRIGIDYAGSWAQKPWRFFDAASRFVSGPAKLNAKHSSP